MALPETVIIDVGDLLLRLRTIVASKLKLARVEVDTPYSPANVNIDEYIEMVVDSLVSQTSAMESLNQLITLALNDRNGAMDERICDVLEVMGQLIHRQLTDLRLYEPDSGPLYYFYTSRGYDWILLTRTIPQNMPPIGQGRTTFTDYTPYAHLQSPAALTESEMAEDLPPHSTFRW